MPETTQKLSHLAQLTNLFPHRYNWILKRDDKSWITLKYKLDDEQLMLLYQEPTTIIGVGFDKDTPYLMLDIDKKSQYHYNQNPEAIDTIKHILAQELGLEKSIIIQSSYSEGVHIYFPLGYQVKSYALGKTVTDILEAHGYEVKAGVLEVFPNKKKGEKTDDRSKWSMYNRHRLPLQPESGSWILGEDFNPVPYFQAESLGVFVSWWEEAKAKQNMVKLKEAMYGYGKKGKSTAMGKIEAELIKQIAQGFTEDAQTNDILLNLARRVRIVQRIGETALRDRLIEIVTIMKGYRQYCGHQHNIEQRCQDVSRWATKKFYIVGEKNSAALPKLKTSNSKKEHEAKVRILEALFVAFGRTYESTREFIQTVLVYAKCSPNTLYKYKSEWEDRLQELLVKQSNGEENNVKALPIKSYSNVVKKEKESENLVNNSRDSKALNSVALPKKAKNESVCKSPTGKDLNQITPTRARTEQKGLKALCLLGLEPILTQISLLRLFMLSSSLGGLFGIFLHHGYLTFPPDNSSNQIEQSTKTPSNSVIQDLKQQQILNVVSESDFSTLKNTEVLLELMKRLSLSQLIKVKSKINNCNDVVENPLEFLVNLFQETLTPLTIGEGVEPSSGSNGEINGVINCFKPSLASVRSFFQKQGNSSSSDNVNDSKVEENNLEVNTSVSDEINDSSSAQDNFKSPEQGEVNSVLMDSDLAQPPLKQLNFVDWYKEAIAQGIVEDVPINWLPKMSNEYMVRLPVPDSLTGAPYTLRRWREVAYPT